VDLFFIFLTKKSLLSRSPPPAPKVTEKNLGENCSNFFNLH
jgi:hypothetical protein